MDITSSIESNNNGFTIACNADGNIIISKNNSIRKRKVLDFKHARKMQL